MTQAEKNKYESYCNKLALVRILQADRRSVTEIINVIKVTYKDDNVKNEESFYNWIKSMNAYVQSYLKSLATELKNAGKKTGEIALEIGRTENYVNLLLNSSQQTALGNTSDSSDANTKLQTLKQRAIEMAEKEKKVSEIATALGVEASYVNTTLLGKAYLKKWAKRLAEQNVKVSVIADRMSCTDKYVRGEDCLGLTYVKAWAKRMADNNSGVKTIADTIGVTVTDIRNYLGSSYLTEWAIRLANANNTVTNIKDILQESDTTGAKNRLGASYFENWAKRLVTAGKTVDEIGVFIDYTPSTVRGTFLKADYMRNWVKSLNDAKKTEAQIRAVTGLTSTNIQKYLDEAKGITKKTTDAASTISTATGKVALPANEKKKYRITELANAGKTIAQIAADDTIKALWGGNSPEISDIRSVVGYDFMKVWIANLASSGKTVSEICTITGYSDASNIRTALTRYDENYLKNWAKQLADDDTSVDDIATILGLSGKTSEKREAVRGGSYLGSSYVSSWAIRMVNSGNYSVSDIASKLGLTTGDIWNSIISNANMRKWLGRIVKQTPDKSVADIKTYLSIPKDKTTWIHDNLCYTTGNKNPNDTFKRWAADLKNTGKTVAQIATHVGETEDYVRGSLLGKSSISVWANNIINQASDNTASDLKTQIGLTTKELVEDSYIKYPNFRSWAIRFTKNNVKDYTNKEILVSLGAIRVVESKKNVWKEVTSKNADTYKADFLKTTLEQEYTYNWISRLSKVKENGTAKYTNKNIGDIVGLTKADVEKYLKMKY